MGNENRTVPDRLGVEHEAMSLDPDFLVRTTFNPETPGLHPAAIGPTPEGF